jgi:hypothetical protein
VTNSNTNTCFYEYFCRSWTTSIQFNSRRYNARLTTKELISIEGELFLDTLYGKFEPGSLKPNNKKEIYSQGEGWTSNEIQLFLKSGLKLYVSCCYTQDYFQRRLAMQMKLHDIWLIELSVASQNYSKLKYSFQADISWTIIW